MQTRNAPSGRRVWHDLTLDELVDVALVSVLALQGTLPVLFPASGSLSSVDPSSGPSRVAYYLISAILLITLFYRALWVARRIRWGQTSVRFAFAFLFYAICSVSWGVSPIVTSIRATLLLAGMIFYANYLSIRYSVERFRVIMGISFGVFAASSILMALVFPQYGVDSAGNLGAWQGLFGQKNALGNAMAFALPIVFTIPACHRLWKYTLLLLSSVVLVGSQSREAWIGAACCLISFFALKMLLNFSPRDRWLPTLIVFMVLVGFVACAIAYGEEILESLGRDTTFSGRTEIWAGVHLLIAKRPILGYGLAGMLGTGFGIWSEVQFRAGWQVPLGSTHSEYLDALLRYGIVGSAILAFSLIVGLKHAVSNLMRESGEKSLLPILLLLTLLICEVAGQNLLVIPGLELVLFFASLFYLNDQAVSGGIGWRSNAITVKSLESLSA